MLAAPGGVSRAELERGRDLAELADLTDSGMLESTDTLPGGEGGCVVYQTLLYREYCPYCTTHDTVCYSTVYVCM